jgi:hypothetical protein
MVRITTAIARTIPKTSANFASRRAMSPPDANIGIFPVPILRAQAAVMCEPRHTRAKKKLFAWMLAALPKAGVSTEPT